MTLWGMSLGPPAAAACVLAEYRAQSKPAQTEVPAKAKLKASHKSKPDRPPEGPADPDAVAKKQFAGLLANARSLIKAGLRDGAKKDLLRIIHEAPGTKVARDAQKELDQLGDP